MSPRNEQPIFAALVDAGVPPGLAYTAVQSIRDMAAAKLDSLGAAQHASAVAQNTKLDAQNAEIRAQRWMIGATLALLAALLGLGLFNVLAPPPTSPVPQPVIVMPAAPAPPADLAAD